MEKSAVTKTNTVLGIIAHVDAGKTTLSEGILYTVGALRKQGRVDHQDTALDTHALEKERGITIFSSVAHFTLGDRPFTLLDTPGHVDFSKETERTLGVLDGAVLVISGSEGVQPHTRTLWRLLSLFEIPTFVFVTKMDYARKEKEELLADLRQHLSDNMVDFSLTGDSLFEELSLTDEEVMHGFLEKGTVSDSEIGALVASRKVFPVYFGSGLRLSGIEAFLEGLRKYAPEKTYPDTFSAAVYKVSHDKDNTRLVHVKITGGVLRPRDDIKTGSETEKVHEIRLYQGEKFQGTDAARAGDLCVLTGLSAPHAGDGLGASSAGAFSVLEPVMRYSVVFTDGTDPVTAMPAFRELEEEDPGLHISWNGFLGEIQVSLMGEVQGEILKRLAKDRFGYDISIERGSVLYKETIEAPVEGVGHYEPLRHYSEVHLLLEPLKRGSGIEIRSACSTDVLGKNWQNLILQHMVEKEHLGVLTGTPITDIRITLVAGRASIVHTVGGDFRESTYRAIRHGLMKAKSRLLEPFYRFRLEIPAENIGRAMTDLREMHCLFLPPFYKETTAVLSGRGPVVTLSGYPKEVMSYTGGLGVISLDPDGYDLCHNEAEVLEKMHYDPTADLENTPDSVFCAHGAALLVPWYEVENYMHLEALDGKKSPAELLALEKAGIHVKAEKTAAPKKEEAAGESGRFFNEENAAGKPAEKSGKESGKPAEKSGKSGRTGGTLASDKELEAIMMREFGAIKRPKYRESTATVNNRPIAEIRRKKEILIVDGYNVIFAWEDLRDLATYDIQAARDRLVSILSNFSLFREKETTVVFDGYRVAGNPGEIREQEGITVVYTKERESGDLYIEKMIGALKKDEVARVVTSDGIIQLAALRKNVLRMSSAEFLEVVDEASLEISMLLRNRSEEGHVTLGEHIDWAKLKNR